MSFKRDGSSITLRAVVEPLVSWIWLGGFIVGLGAIVAGFPTAGRRRRLRMEADRSEPALVGSGGES